MQQSHNLVGDGISLVLQFGYFGYFYTYVFPVIQHILETPGGLYAIAGAFYKKVKEFFFPGNE
jgi:hypothetical protein